MTWTAAGAAFAFLAIALGAFGAHALRTHLAPDLLEAFDLGARYLLVHAVALVALGLGSNRLARRTVSVVGALLVAGMVLFSGSLFALALTGTRAWGAVTPVGGVALLVGWAWLAVASWSAARGEAGR
jgi:uncharacterized membrane protein YgdD (TMEM256/DUF423 family)